MLGQLVFVATAFLSAADVRPAVSGLSFQVVVNEANPATSIKKAELSALFMKRSLRWQNRENAVPVDQRVRNRLREEFSRSVHGKSVAYITRYWQRLIFAGRGIPPFEAESDADVIEFVRMRRGAVGYVSRDTPLPAGVKAIAVRP